MAKTAPFSGRWRILSMSAWDEDYIDEEEKGHFDVNDPGVANVATYSRPSWLAGRTGLLILFLCGTARV